MTRKMGKNRAYKVRSKKRNGQREGTSLSYSKATRVSGLRVEVRAVSDADAAEANSEVHTPDQDDWDAIEGDAYGPGEMPFRYLTLRTIKKLAWKPRARMESFLKLYNPFLRDKHLKVVKGCLNKEEDLPSGAKYFGITIEVAEDALDDILDRGSQLRTSIFSYSSVVVE